MFSPGDRVISVRPLGTAYDTPVEAGTAGTVVSVGADGATLKNLTVDFDSVFGCVRLEGLPVESVAAPGEVAPPAVASHEALAEAETATSPEAEAEAAAPPVATSPVSEPTAATTGVITPAQPPRRPPDGHLGGAAPAPAARSGFGLIPFFVFRMFCSLRASVKVDTALDDAQLQGLFAGAMASPRGLARLGRSGSGYLGHARWAISTPVRGHAVAECRPSGRAAHGFGKSPIFGRAYLDISGDRIELQTGAGPTGGRLEVGPTRYTTRWFMFAFPAMHLYIRGFLKAVRKADPTARLHYPWSVFRIAVWAALLIGVPLIAVTSSHGHGASYSASSSGNGSPSSIDSSAPSTGGSGSGDTTPAGGSEPSAVPTDTTDTTPSPTDTSIANGGPAGAGDVSVDNQDSGAQSSAMASLLSTYFSGINSRDFQSAWSVFDANGQQAAGGYDAFVNGDRTTVASQVVLHTVSDNGDGSFAADVTFQSTQAGSEGVNTGETCTDWDITYRLVPNGGSGFLIDDVTAATHTAC